MNASIDALSRLSTAIISRNLVWDNHGCMPLRPFDESFMPQLERYRAAGVDAVMINVGFGDHSIEAHIRMLAHFRRWLKARPDRFVLIDSLADVDSARATGRLAVGFDIEGAAAIDDQISLVQLYYDLGVRWMLMAYNTTNHVGGGCHEDDPGLTVFGRALLDEMARVGMVACCSHTGERTAMDVMLHSRNPVIFSHSNPKALHDHPRSISDAVMRACAAGGGVVGITGPGVLLGANDNSTERFVQHIDYAVQLIGARHVGIGLDYMFDMAEVDDYLAKMKHTFPQGLGYDQGIRMVEPERMAEIVEALLRRGYAEADIAGLLGGNWRRVAEVVWRPTQARAGATP